MRPNNYRGWVISFDRYRPVTGIWRAVRHGVGMGASTEERLRRMIDTKLAEEQAERDRRRNDPLVGMFARTWRELNS